MFTWFSLCDVIIFYVFFLLHFFFFRFLGLHQLHMEVPMLGVKLELQLLAYTTAAAMWDLIWVCDLYHSSWQHQILNPLSEARDRTCVLMNTIRGRYHWAMTGTPFTSFLKNIFFCLYEKVICFIYRWLLRRIQSD